MSGKLSHPLCAHRVAELGGVQNIRLKADGPATFSVKIGEFKHQVPNQVSESNMNSFIATRRREGNRAVAHVDQHAEHARKGLDSVQ